MIIDVRARLPLRRRIGSDLCTAGLWGVCAWLMMPTISSIGQTRHLQTPHVVAAGISMPALNGVLGVLALVVGAFIWVRARQRKSLKVAQEAVPNYAHRFGLTEAQLAAYRTSQTCIVHHNEAGDIIGIDAPPALALVQDTAGDMPPAAMLIGADHAQASFATAA